MMSVEGNTTNGPNIPYNWLTVNNTDATMIMTEMEGWEDDCGSGCNYNPNPSFWSSCFSIGDDNKDGRGTSGNINFLSEFSMQYGIQYEINTGDYYARIQIYWTYVGGISARNIDGNQTICPSGDPIAFTSTNNANPFHSSFSCTNGKKTLDVVEIFQILLVQI